MKRNEKGFTLVEVLATLVLVSIIALLASSIHLFAQNQTNTQREEIHIQSNERAAMRLIKSEIRKAVKVETNHPNELIINGTDEYRLEESDLKKNDITVISGIKKFAVTMHDNQIKLKIGSMPETTIYIRE